MKVFVVQFFKFLPAGAPQIWAGPAAEDSKKRSDSDPVLLFWYFSGCPNSGIFLLFGVSKILSSTRPPPQALLYYTCDGSRPHTQNTSAVVGNLKYRSGSIGSWVLSEIPPIDPVRPIEKDTQKRVDRVGDGSDQSVLRKERCKSTKTIFILSFRPPRTCFEEEAAFTSRRL